MRTNIVIDDKLMAEALRVTGLETQCAVVERGSRRRVMLNAQARIRELRGKVRWEDDLPLLHSDRYFEPFSRHLGLQTVG